MTINILLVIGIILLFLGLFLQILQFIAIATLPDRIVDSLIDSFPSDSFPPDSILSVVDVEVAASGNPPPSKGFGKSKKSKKSKWGWASTNRVDNKSTDTDESKKIPIDLSEN